MKFISKGRATSYFWIRLLMINLILHSNNLASILQLIYEIPRFLHGVQLLHGQFYQQMIGQSQYIQLMSEDYTETHMMALNGTDQREHAINKLSLVWNQYQMIRTYQNIFNEYVDQMPTTSFLDMCKAEIELTKVQQSFGYSIQQFARQRKTILQKLYDEVGQLQRKPNKTQRDLKMICDIISELRNINLQYSQLLLNVHNYFKSAAKEENFSQTVANQFVQLDQDNEYLKKSLVRKFILFSKTYDPFFLKHREVLKSTNNPRLKEVKCIQDLFTLPISYAYRLEKTQSNILKYLQRSNSKDTLKRRRIISAIREDSRGSRRGDHQMGKLLYPQRDSNKLSDSFFKLDKDIYLSSDKAGIQRLDIRKRSQDDMSPNSPHNKSSNRNMSLRQMKQKDVYLPRLNNHSSKARNTGKQSNLTKETSISTWRQNTYKSINQMEERQHQIKSLRPKKFEKALFKQSIHRQMPKNKETSTQCDSITQRPIQVVRTHSPAPISVSVQTKQQSDRKLMNQPYKRIQTIENQQLEKSKYKKYQLKASPITIQKIFETLYGFQFNENYRKIIEIGSWQNSIKHNQYYFHKLFINDDISAIALCCGLPDGDIVLKCWAPLKTCDQQMSTFLFGKFIEHIEKNTLCKSIIYNNFPIKELSTQSFVMKKDRIYERLRVLETKCQRDDYHPFLSLNFTNVAINKQTKRQQTLMNTHSFQRFQPNNFICFNYLLIINKLLHSGSFSDVSGYYPKLPSIKESNFKLLSNNLSPDPYNIQFQCSYCHLLTFKLRNVIKNAFFLADKGYLKLNGEVIDENDDSIIVCLSMLKYNTKIYFGKGFNSAAEMAERYKKAAKRDNLEKVSFSVRMFKKRLRGQMLSINLKEENTYGDFQLTFCWRDYLKGKIEHDIKDSDEVFDETFYCLIEMERELLFVFNVEPSNFIV